MPRRLLVLTAGVVALAGACTGGPDRTVPAAPTAADVASAAAFCALPVPAGAVGPLRREQGIDGLVVFRVGLDDRAARAWLAAGGMPAPGPSAGVAGREFGPDLPSGTPVVAQHRAGRPGGGVVYRSAVLGPGEVEVRCFET